MKYNLIGSNDYLINPVETVLENRGIVDIEAFMNVNINDTHHYSLLENIDLAVDMILKHMESGSKIKLVVDSK